LGIIINQSIRNATISYIGIVIGFIATIKLYPTILDTDQFGLTRIFIAISTLSSQVVNIGIPTSIVKFFPTLSKKTDRPNGLFWAFCIPPLIGFGVYVLLAFVFRQPMIDAYQNDSSLFGTYYEFILPLVFFSSSFALLNAYVKAHLDSVFASFLQDVLQRLIVILALGLFFFDYISFDGFILIFAGNYALQYILLLSYALAKKYISFHPSFVLFRPDERSFFFSYSFYAFFSGFTLMLVGNIDLLMVGTFEGLSKSGIYAIALYVGSVISVPKKAVSKISLPIISKSFANHDLLNIKKVYAQSSLNQFLAGFLIYIGVIANIDNLYRILPPEYAEGSIVIYIIGFTHLFDMLCGANGQIIIASKYFRFDLYASIVLMVSAVVLNYLLIPIYGLAGAASATAISVVLFNIIKLIFIRIKFNTQPFRPQLLLLTLIGLTIIYLSRLFNPMEWVYADILVRSITITMVYLFAVRMFKLSDEVNQTIDAILKRLFPSRF
jgi:O-antigen/teichoic acid export membrane protein